MDIKIDYPDYSISLFKSHLKYTGQLLKIAVVHEFYYTLCAAFQISKQPDNLHIPFFKRWDDVGAAFTSGLFTVVSEICLRAIYLPLALMVSIFSLLDFGIHFVYAIVACITAIFFNLSYLGINNLLIHIVILGFVTHLFTILTTMVFAPIDNAAHRRFINGLLCFGMTFISLYELIEKTICYPASILLGTKFLLCPEDADEALYFESTEDFDHIFGINCNLVDAFSDFYHSLSEKLSEAALGVQYILSTPFFASTELLIFMALSLCATIKFGMSIPFTLMRSATSSIISQPSMNKTIAQNPLLLAELRTEHDAAFEASMKTKVA